MKDCKQQWWKDAKYGLFIHWGLYAQLAGEWKGQRTPGTGGEWIMKHLQIPVEEYEKLAEEFNPIDFNAKEWVSLAKKAGMKYIVITAKHHDGFAMYHSQCSKYNIVDATPFKRDPMKELAEECAKENIKLCFYYSQAQDWHEPNGYGYGPVPNEEKDFKQYLEDKCKPQLRELLTGYGDIGLIWFDTPQIMSYEHSKELFDLVKSIQPNCIVSGRIGNQLGEYMSTGDNWLPAHAYPGDWEVPATLNDTWGFKYFDNNWKQPDKILELLLKINSRGGSYLLNVGPDAKGLIPKESVDILSRIGEWLDKNGESIYETAAAPEYPYETKGFYFTYKPGRLYVHILGGKADISIPCVGGNVKRAVILGSNEDAEYTRVFNMASKSYRLNIKLPEHAINSLDTVVMLELDESLPIFDSLDVL